MNIVHENLQSLTGKALNIELLNSQPTNNNKNNNVINLVHQNIQCIKGKDLEIELFLNNFNIDILCVTEHWLKNHEFMFNFGHHQVGSSFSRTNAIHGGSLILLNKKLKFKSRNDIVSLSVERTIELAAVELEQLIIVSVYRPPLSNFELFEKVMDEVLFKITKSNKKLIVCGDFNVNILESSPLTIKLLNLFKSYNLSNMFMEPTRITATSATCIDNIFTNLNPISKEIISKLDSDHCGQLIKFVNLKKIVTKRKITFVPVTSGRIEKIRTSLVKDLPFLPHMLCPNEMYNLFFNKFSTIFNSIFTSKSALVTDATVFSEWASIELHKDREKLYELYAERQYDTSDEFKQYVQSFSKKFKRDCNMAKSKHIQAKIKNSSNVVKTTWKIISEETGKVSQGSSDFKLNVDNKSVTSDAEVATAFETFFTEIPASTTKPLNSSPVAALSLLEDNVPECNKPFKFSHVSCSDVIKAFKLINNKKTSDLWGVSVSVVKSLIDIVAPELALIFNNCIDCGVFPDLMKHSKITPLFKSGSTSDPTNFRPISVLPTFSKIFEKLILTQLRKHFYINDLLYNKQFGFTRGRSTTDAGVELIQNIFEAWEESRDALGVFCDLSKAFDCVEHETLVRKLHHYGIRGEALDLMSSYLNNRVQRVDVNGKRSHGSVVKMGVPQGSILGPFLFLIYINDLPYLTKGNHEMILFADDTSLLFKINRYLTSLEDVNNSLTEVVQWFEANNLLLNGKKTKCVKFTLPNVKHMKTTVQLNNEELNLVDTAVFLGITLDAKLQWGPHINNLSNRLSSAAYAVKKIRQLTDIETARLVYFSYFHSIMSYGILLWGNAADINSIFVLQKRAVRAIYTMGPRESLRNKFKEVKIMTVYNQYIFENLVYVHKHINKFKKKCDSHNLNTRNKNKLVMPTSRLSKVHNSFIGNCVRFYNKLPDYILEMSINKFKVIIKRKLIEKSYYSIKDYVNEKKAWE